MVMIGKQRTVWNMEEDEGFDPSSGDEVSHPADLT